MLYTLSTIFQPCWDAFLSTSVEPVLSKELKAFSEAYTVCIFFYVDLGNFQHLAAVFYCFLVFHMFPKHLYMYNLHTENDLLSMNKIFDGSRGVGWGVGGGTDLGKTDHYTHRVYNTKSLIPDTNIISYLFV